MSIEDTITAFVALAIRNGAAEPLDEIYWRNQILHFIGETDWRVTAADRAVEAATGPVMGNQTAVAGATGLMAGKQHSATASSPGTPIVAASTDIATEKQLSATDDEESVTAKIAGGPLVTASTGIAAAKNIGATGADKSVTAPNAEDPLVAGATDSPKTERPAVEAATEEQAAVAGATSIVAAKNIDATDGQKPVAVATDLTAVKSDPSTPADSLPLMDALLAAARANGLATDDTYAAQLMSFITPRPSRVNRDFWADYATSPQAATEHFYALAEAVNQVKTRDIARNIAFTHASPYGKLEITINLSKPEKDPKAIAAAKLDTVSNYPACALCLENEGLYASGSAGRSNHRIVRLTLGGEPYGFQYSPYAYFNEHAIVMNVHHQPMIIDRRAFTNLLNFLDVFPHYMIGSNADLPIVGGSILTHDHYQAGRHDFPMAKAGIRESVKFDGFATVAAGIVKWPMSVLRLMSDDKAALVALATKILGKWRRFDAPDLDVVSKTSDGLSHHTITPIARRRDGRYELDLVLRDNNTSDAHPDGIFHPHADLHHIKKENIGLIEVMGLAILPPRLAPELAEVEKYLTGQPNAMADSHRPWADRLRATETFTADTVKAKLRAAVGDVFTQVLRDAGVFKDDPAGHEGFRHFVQFINEEQ